jgi:hypothetical protein
MATPETLVLSWPTRLSQSLEAIGRCRAALLCLLLLVAGSYWNILHTFFVQDDFFLLTAAQRPMPNIEMLRGACFLRPLPTYWLPLLNVTFWGLNPFWHHVTYLTLFLATLAFLCSWLHSLTNSTVAALMGTALYAFSKTHLYTLAWIAGGIDVTAALFFVMGLWAVDRYFKRSAQAGGQAHRPLLWTIGAAFACGLLCKESCIVFLPACLAWIAARKVVAPRRFEPAEWKLLVLLIAIVTVYLPLWRTASAAVGTPAGQVLFDLRRGETVLINSVIAVIPASETAVPYSQWWLLAPLALVALVVTRRQGIAASGRNVVLCLSLWVLPAAIFVFTKYPWQLQLYYAHFSVIGLAAMVALAAESLITIVEATRWRYSIACVLAVSFAAWAGMASHAIRAGIIHRDSPAMFESDCAKAMYEQLEGYLRSGPYRKIVFLDISELVWASMQYGEMIPALFPGVETDRGDRRGATVSEYERTSSTILVVRQTGDRHLTVVR